jgi:hypothetical protein
MENTLDAARSVMATTVARWEHLVASVPPDVLERPSAPGEWSAAECLAHLLFTERHLFSVRLRNLLAGEDMVPPFPTASYVPTNLLRRIGPRGRIQVPRLGTDREERDHAQARTVCR